MALSFGLKQPKPTGFSITDTNFSDSPEDPRTMGGPQPMAQTLAPAVRPRPYAGPIPQRPKTGAEEFINTQLSTRKLRSGGPNGMRGKTLGQLSEQARTSYAGMSPDQRKTWEDRAQLNDVRSEPEKQAQKDYENRVNSLFNPSFAGANSPAGSTISSGTSAPITDPSAVTPPAAQPGANPGTASGTPTRTFSAPKPPDTSPMTASGRTLNEQNALFPPANPVRPPTSTTIQPVPITNRGDTTIAQTPYGTAYAGPNLGVNPNLAGSPRTFAALPSTGSYAGPRASMAGEDDPEALKKKKQMLSLN